eukprot:TRINITY_DN3676_c0_g1_i3.p1 TRINITY_DN3676_c0_g1~~TRINITY_DN3676_c0_g1_i3.p1  ORF type:complete len:308 (+),score=20.57 TRINITY_DN3676_c0_g1_i3:195-1118(+)
MPLRVCASETRPVPMTYPQLTEEEFQARRDERCPLEPSYFTKDIFCYPRPECTGDADCVASTDPPLCHDQCLNGTRLKGLRILPASVCRLNASGYCDDHAGFTRQQPCTTIRPGRVRFWAVTIVLAEYHAHAHLFVPRFAKAIRVRPGRVRVSAPEQRRATPVTAIVSEDQAIDRPCKYAMERLQAGSLGPPFVVISISAVFEARGFDISAPSWRVEEEIPRSHPAQAAFDFWYIWPTTSFAFVFGFFVIIMVQQRIKEHNSQSKSQSPSHGIIYDGKADQDTYQRSQGSNTPPGDSTWHVQNTYFQ